MPVPNVDQLKELQHAEQVYAQALQDAVEALEGLTDKQRALELARQDVDNAEDRFLQFYQTMLREGRALDEARRKAGTIVPAPLSTISVVPIGEREET